MLDGYMMLPVVLAGRCVLEIEGERHVLEAGSAALVTRASSHRLVSSPGVECAALFDIPVEQISEKYEHMRFGGGGERTLIAYAAMRIDAPLTARLIDELPSVIRVDAWGDSEAGTFHAVLRMLAAEAEGTQPGGEAVMTRLADVLVIQVLRWWLRTTEFGASGWLAALRDPNVGRALSRMHASPGRDWSLEELAKRANMSRSAFAARFAALVGEPPMRYLAHWRLEQAHAELSTTTDSIATISNRVGYTSEAAFNRAFKRRHGATPGSVRRTNAAVNSVLGAASLIR